MEAVGKGGEAARLIMGRGDNRDDSADECPVCLMVYGDTCGRPRILPCGHTFCTRCVHGITNQGQATCPTCRGTYAVPQTGQFPVSYTVEDLIRRLRNMTSAIPLINPQSTIRKPGQNRTEELSKPLRSLLQGRETKVLAAVGTNQQVQAQLNRFQTTLTEWCEQQRQFEERLLALVDQSRNAMALVQREKSQVTTKKEQVQQEEQQLLNLLPALRTAATQQEAYETIAHADHCLIEESQREKECQEMFPDVHTVTTITKERAVSSAALEAAMNVRVALETVAAHAGAAAESNLPVAPDIPITDKLEILLAPTMKAKDLLRLTQPARSMVQAGLVYSVHLVKGRNRHGRISLEDGRLYLHSLQDKPLPPFAATVQVKELVPPSPPCQVFLDLAWPSTTRRRVLVHLSPDTPLGRQFLLLCTGQQGPSYINTKLFDVVNKRRPGEWVAGGVYDGDGGSALLPDLHNGNYRQSGKAGDVCRTWRGRNKFDWNARFGICTRDKEEGVFNDVFGEVVTGLDVVVEAAQHSPIKEVTVVDCGVVLL